MNQINTPITQTTSDEAAIRALLERQGQAWQAGDADAYAAVFSEDADYTIFDGTHYKGRQTIAESHRPLFARFLKGTRLVSVSSELRFLTPDVALILSKGAVAKAGQRAPSRSRLSCQTTVAVRGPRGWELAAFQNTRYRPFAETLLGKLLVRIGIAPAPTPERLPSAA